MYSVRPYNRDAAVRYAKKWALGRNPAYFDFSNYGGDCTNFISQCLFAGAGQMNYTPTFGWYFISARNRAPAWSGVPFLYNFLTGNKGIGPFAQVTESEQLKLGDVIQLGDSRGEFYHSLMVTGFSSEGILISTHSYDALDRPLNSYHYQTIRFLHIEGVHTQ